MVDSSWNKSVQTGNISVGQADFSLKGIFEMQTDGKQHIVWIWSIILKVGSLEWLCKVK